MKNSTYPKEYRTSTYWLQFTLWVVACFAVIGNVYKAGRVVIHRPEYLVLAVFQLVIQVSVLVFMYHMIQDFRLSISESGIKLSMWSRTIYVEWHQVKRLDYAYFQKQLVIENPIVEKRKAWWLWLDFHKLRSDDSFKLIPFSGWAWEKFDEIEVEVKKQLPHLFESTK